MGHFDSTAINELIARMRVDLAGRDMSEKVQRAWLFWAHSLLNRFSDRHPVSIGFNDIVRFVDETAHDHQINDAGRRLALEAIHFLLSEVVGRSDAELEVLRKSVRTRPGPVILSPAEVQQVLAELKGSQWLMASLIYGAGLRLNECARLRVRDLKGNRILVCDANGQSSRETLMPERVREPMRTHLEDLKIQHIRELADGFGTVSMPAGFRAPASTARAWIWQFVFPGPYMSEPSRSNSACQRHHVPEPEVGQAIEQAARQAGIDKPVSGNTLRNSFAAHLIRRGIAVCDVEKLLGVEKPGKISASQDRSKFSQPAPGERQVEAAAIGF